MILLLWKIHANRNQFAAATAEEFPYNTQYDQRSPVFLFNDQNEWISKWI